MSLAQLRRSWKRCLSAARVAKRVGMTEDGARQRVMDHARWHTPPKARPSESEVREIVAAVYRGG